MKKSTTITSLSTTALLGMLVVLMVPSNVSATETSGLALYGMATLTQHDVNGDVVFSQTVHNQLFDDGEDFLLNNAFHGLTDDAAEATQIGAICLGAQTPSTDETHTVAAWNSAHDGADNASATASTLNCQTATATSSAQVASLAPEAFTAKADNSGNWYSGDTVLGIAVCQADSGDADVRGCAGTLFAVVNTSDVTLATDETVTVTYQFSLASAGT